MDLVFVSDTHELHRDLEIPPADVLIHCGDFTMFSRSVSGIRDFDDWLGSLPHRLKIVVPGNHEFFLEAAPARRSLISNAVVLINESHTINGLNIYGSPVTPMDGGAFGMSSSEDRKLHWSRIPLDTHVLVTHGPPRGILDRQREDEEHLGDPELLSRVQKLQALRIHAFGHIHGAYGQLDKEDVTYLNAALMGRLGGITRRPVTLRMQRAAQQITRRSSPAMR